MVIISRAIEETVKEEHVLAADRERRLKLILLERTTQDRGDGTRDPTELRETRKDEIVMNMRRDVERLDQEKATREQYDVEAARTILINLMVDLANETRDSRFETAVEVLTKPADYF